MVTGSVVGVKLTFSSLFENKLEISAPESNDQLTSPADVYRCYRTNLVVDVFGSMSAKGKE